MKTVILTSCKPWSGDQIPIQEAALRSWLELSSARVVVLGDEESGVAFHAKRVLGDRGSVVPTSALRTARSLGFGYGAPLLDAVVEAGDRVTDPGDVVVYSNSDIIFTRPADELLERFAASGPEPFAAVGRWNIDEARHAGPSAGRREEPTGADVFLWTHGWWKRTGAPVLPFILGRFFFDTYMMANALRYARPALDLSDALHVCHPRHDRSEHLAGVEKGKTVQRSQGQRYNELLFLPHGGPEKDSPYFGNLASNFPWLRQLRARPCVACDGTGEVRA